MAVNASPGVRGDYMYTISPIYEYMELAELAPLQAGESSRDLLLWGIEMAKLICTC